MSDALTWCGFGCMVAAIVVVLWVIWYLRNLW